MTYKDLDAHNWDISPEGNIRLWDDTKIVYILDTFEIAKEYIRDNAETEIVESEEE